MRRTEMRQKRNRLLLTLQVTTVLQGTIFLLPQYQAYGDPNQAPASRQKTISKSRAASHLKTENKSGSRGYVVLKSEIPSLAVPKLLQGAVNQNGGMESGESQSSSNQPESPFPAIASIKSESKLNELAQQYMQRGSLNEAEACLQQATNLNPLNGQAFAELARLQARAGKQNAAIASFWIGRELGFTTPADDQTLSELQSRLTDQCRSSGMRYHDYLEYGERNDVRSLLNQGVRFYSIGDHKDAWRLFSEAAKQAPQNPDAYFNLGALCESLGLNDRAKQFYLLACKIDPTDFDSRLGLGTPGKGNFGYQGKINNVSLNGSVSVCPKCRLARGQLMRGD